LEYLDKDESRVQFVSGRLMIKLANFTDAYRADYKKAQQNSSNWVDGNIGFDKTIGYLDFTPSEVKKAESFKIEKTYVQKEGTRKDGKTIDRRVKAKVNSQAPSASGAAKGLILLNLANFAVEQYGIWSHKIDRDKLNTHKLIAAKVAQNMQVAIQKGMIPEPYLNEKCIAGISNVVLQGENLTNDPKIYEIGMDIYNTISLAPPTYYDTVEISPNKTTPESDNTRYVRKDIILRKP